VEDHGDYIKIIVPESRTMQRAVYIVTYQRHLRDWLAEHPWGSDPDAFLFPARTKGPYHQVNRTTIYNYLSKLKKKLGIKTRFYPHLLRHKRATELYGELAEKDMMVLFGWKTRTMLDVYAHITQKHVEEKVLSLYGISNKDKQLDDIICPRCGAKNPHEASYCWRCGTPLKSEILLSMNLDKERLRELLVRLFNELGAETPEELLDL